MKLIRISLTALILALPQVSFAATGTAEDAPTVTATQVTTAPATATAVENAAGPDFDNSCSCQGPGACAVSCAWDTNAVCQQNSDGYCFCSCN